MAVPQARLEYVTLTRAKSLNCARARLRQLLLLLQGCKGW